MYRMSHSSSNTHTNSHTHTLSLSQTHYLSLSHTHTHSLPLTHTLPLSLTHTYILSLTPSLSLRLTVQGEELHCEDAFDMLGGVDKNTFKPVYGDLEYLTLVSFDGFEITRQVREGLD